MGLCGGNLESTVGANLTPVSSHCLRTHFVLKARSTARRTACLAARCLLLLFGSGTTIFAKCLRKTTRHSSAHPKQSPPPNKPKVQAAAHIWGIWCAFTMGDNGETSAGEWMNGLKINWESPWRWLNVGRRAVLLISILCVWCPHSWSNSNDSKKPQPNPVPTQLM